MPLTTRELIRKLYEFDLDSVPVVYSDQINFSTIDDVVSEQGDITDIEVYGTFRYYPALYFRWP